MCKFFFFFLLSQGVSGQGVVEQINFVSVADLTENKAFFFIKSLCPKFLHSFLPCWILSQTANTWTPEFHNPMQTCMLHSSSLQFSTTHMHPVWLLLAILDQGQLFNHLMAGLGYVLAGFTLGSLPKVSQIFLQFVLCILDVLQDRLACTPMIQVMDLPASMFLMTSSFFWSISTFLTLRR